MSLLIFYIWCEVGVWFHSFAYDYPVISTLFVEKTIHFPHWIVLELLMNIIKLTKIKEFKILDSQFYSIDLYIYVYANTIDMRLACKSAKIITCAGHHTSQYYLVCLNRLFQAPKLNLVNLVSWWVPCRGGDLILSPPLMVFQIGLMC